VSDESPWLGPDTDRAWASWPVPACARVAVICPGFAVDCLETLEEIAIRGAECFRAAGGERLDYIPALNDSSAHVNLLAALVRRHAGRTPRPTTTPAAGSGAVSPRAVRIAAGALELEALEYGDPSARPVLALHGWLDNAASFERLAPLIPDVR
jgi:ferrochelatase